MGSFDLTCCVSGLPIGDGDEVRYFLLTQNTGFKGRFICDSYGRWAPRTWPLKARYNDYGSVDNVEEGPAKDLWMKGFQEDLLEVGLGDNEYHDLAASKDMSFEQLLAAVWEGRVHTGPKPSTPMSEEEKAAHHEKYSPEHLPTIKNVGVCLEENWGTFWGDEDNPILKKLLIDEGVAWIRVRETGYSTEGQLLKNAAEILNTRFATVLCAGSGDYAKHLELRCFMSPGLEKNGASRRSSDGIIPYTSRYTPRLIQQGMIREDVWQEILRMKLPTVGGFNDDKYEVKPGPTVSQYREGARKFLKAILENEKKQETDLLEFSLSVGRGKSDYTIFSRAHRAGEEMGSLAHDTPGASLLFCDPPNGLGPQLHSHAKILVMAGEVTESFVDTVAEFTFVWDFLDNVRHVWRPSDSCGPQFGAWEQHVEFHQALAGICDKVMEEKKG